MSRFLACVVAALVAAAASRHPPQLSGDGRQSRDFVYVDDVVDALVRAAGKAERTPEVYVQVNIGDEPQKGGVAIAELGRFLDRVRASPLPLAGLMCIPPAELEPEHFGLTDADLDKPVRMYGELSTERAAFITALTHIHEHLGQSIAYARMNGVVPPWSAM